MRKYLHGKIEKKWRERWEDANLYSPQDNVSGKENFYNLVEFPYPSGNLHTGHWYAFAVPDMFVRMKRMQGLNVLYPIGFDAFGLPAENAAIKRGINPREWTFENIAYMRTQLRSMGTAFDWSREVITADPNYYKWTQWFFIKFFERGLAYQAETPVNWCPSCKTVLANEQVVNGTCERCGSLVEQRLMQQWMFKITDYAEKLLDGLLKLEWPEEIKEAQRNWIGKSEGTLLEFKLKAQSSKLSAVSVFTTRPDTLFGVTYLVLAPEHPLIEEIKTRLENWDKIAEYISAAKKKTVREREQGEKEKTGIELKGVKAVHPATKEEIPIWIADYVLGTYGTGAIMAVPAHDERDFAFAESNGLKMLRVVNPLDDSIVGVGALIQNKDGKYILQVRDNKTIHDPERIAPFGGGRKVDEVIEDTLIREVCEELGLSLSENQFQFYDFVASDNFPGKYIAIFSIQSIDPQRLRVQEGRDKVMLSAAEIAEHPDVTDFTKRVISTFHSGGLVHAFTPEGILINSGEFTGTKSSEIMQKISDFVGGKRTTEYRLRDWVVSRQRYWGAPIPIILCEKCGAVPVPEEDLPVLLPDVSDYLPTGDGRSPLAKSEDWLNVTCPKCKGAAKRETDTMDTFVDSSWYFLRYTDQKNNEAFASSEKMGAWIPVDHYSGGAEHTTMHLLYSRFFIKVLHDLGLIEWDEPYVVRRNRGLILGPDGQKMSKSRGNVVDPDEYVTKLGADTVRMYLAFLGPYDVVSAYPWDPQGILGIRRFLERVWKRAQLPKGKNSTEFEQLLNSSIKKITEDIETLHFNTAISQLMILMNAIEKDQAVDEESWHTFIRLLAPFAPHIAEEVWEMEGKSTSVHEESWPSYDKEKLIKQSFTLIVQINGKVRGSITARSGLSKEEATELATSIERVKEQLKGDCKKVIYVENRLINFVL